MVTTSTETVRFSSCRRHPFPSEMSIKIPSFSLFSHPKIDPRWWRLLSCLFHVWWPFGPSLGGFVFSQDINQKTTSILSLIVANAKSIWYQETFIQVPSAIRYHVLSFSYWISIASGLIIFWKKSSRLTSAAVKRLWHCPEGCKTPGSSPSACKQNAT